MSDEKKQRPTIIRMTGDCRGNTFTNFDVKGDFDIVKMEKQDGKSPIDNEFSGFKVEIPSPTPDFIDASIPKEPALGVAQQSVPLHKQLLIQVLGGVISFILIGGLIYLGIPH